MLNGKEINYTKLKQREIYFHCLYPQKIPKCYQYWKDILGKEILTIDMYQTISKTIQGNKQKDFHWKCFHRAIYSETRLQQMGKSNGTCKLCHISVETTCHLLYHCQCINQVWRLLEQKIVELLNIIIDINLCSVIYGIKHGDSKNGKNNEIVINSLLQEAKWQIWKNRNHVKYGEKNTLPVDQLFNKIVKGCKREFELYKNAQRFEIDEFFINIIGNF